MDASDFTESEVGLAVLATATVLSPGTRRVVKRGAAYGIAGAVRVGETVAGVAQGVAGAAQGAVRSVRPGGSGKTGPRSRSASGGSSSASGGSSSARARRASSSSTRRRPTSRRSGSSGGSGSSSSGSSNG